MAGRPAARRHLGIKRIAHLSASGLGASSYGVNPPLLFGPGGGLRLPMPRQARSSKLTPPGLLRSD